MSEPAEDLLHRTVERLAEFSRTAFGVGLALTREDEAPPASGARSDSAAFPRPVGRVPGGRLLLVAEGTTRRQLAPPQPLLEQFLDMAADLLGSLVAREAAAIEPMREELWRDLLGSPAIVGVSAAAVALRAAIPAAANSREPLFVGGEPGSGRRSLAATIHRAGPHAGGPFIAEQIAATPEHLRLSQLFGTDRAPGLAAAAAGGTLYLADVEHLPPDCQERLLQHLAAGAGNGAGPARIVTSGDVDLDLLVRRGRLRRDLAERLAALRITIAPLRQRPEDIPLIAAHLLRRRAMASGTAVPTVLAEALDALKSHPWTGNVRELDEALARAGASRGLIRAEDLPETIAGARREPSAASGSSLRSAVSELEVGLISRALDDTNWNKSRAARFLGLSRLGLQKKIDRYGIDRRR